MEEQKVNRYPNVVVDSSGGRREVKVRLAKALQLMKKNTPPSANLKIKSTKTRIL